MVDLSIVRDPRSDAEIKLDRLRAISPQIDRRLRLLFATRIAGHVQKNWLRGQALKRRSGDLAASICHIDESQHATFIGSYGVIYARIHELGGTIRPRYKKYLRFPTERGRGGKVSGWVTTREVHIPKRPYIMPAIEHYMEFSDMAEVDADKFLQKELDKVGGA